MRSNQKYYAMYMKERRRVQRFMSSARKRGYEFDEGILPKIPKRITEASVNRLRNLTPKALYKKSVKVDWETGEVLRGDIARERIKQDVAKRRKAERRGYADYYKMMIESIKDAMAQTALPSEREEMLKALNRVVSRLGDKYVASQAQEYIEQEGDMWHAFSYMKSAARFFIRLASRTGDAGMQAWAESIIDQYDWSNDYLD